MDIVNETKNVILIVTRYEVANSRQTLTTTAHDVNSQLKIYIYIRLHTSQIPKRYTGNS